MAGSSLSTIEPTRVASMYPPSEQPGMLDRLAGFRLRQAQMAIANALLEITQPYGLTMTQFGVLALIGERPGINQTDLGLELAIDRSTMVAVIDRLQNRNLVVRHASPRDRRSYALALSSEGAALLHELSPKIEARDRELLRTLTRKERDQLIGMLARIAR